ncbi:MAG TPA: DNA polymerase III subunit delta [Methylomirabilota bacterium]|nr:DNA polymerase III subunit delta [Methylomirabilota bacterium]
MDYPGFLRLAERGELPAVLLLHGPDAQLLDDALELLTRRCFPEPADAALGREVLEGGETTAEAVVHAASTLPLMTGLRLVAVRRAQALAAKHADALAGYARNPNPSTRLLLLADEGLGASRDRRADHWLLGAVPAAAVVELPARQGRELAAWLRQRASLEGLELSDEAARMLVEWIGDESAALLGEARKAALAGGADNRTVGVREVSAVVGEHRVAGVFELTRAVERRDVAQALRTLDRLLATEEPMRVLAVLTRDVRLAWTVRVWRERGQPLDQIARTLRLPPAVVDALAAGGTAERLAADLRRCWEVERRVKSSGEPRAELTALVAQLCAAR